MTGEGRVIGQVKGRHMAYFGQILGTREGKRRQLVFATQGSPASSRAQQPGSSEYCDFHFRHLSRFSLGLKPIAGSPAFPCFARLGFLAYVL